MAESMFKDLIKLPLLAITIAILTYLSIFLKLPLMIPPFAASLFMLYLREGSEFAQFKNILAGHLIGFAGALMGPLFQSYFSFLPQSLIAPTILGVCVLGVGLIMTITKVQHPPAIATVLLFLNLDGGGFNQISFKIIVSFLIAVTVVSFVAYGMESKSDHKSTGHQH